MTQAIEPTTLPTPADAAPVAGRRWYCRTWFVLSLLTLIGAALRFYDIGRPALWGDEVATYQRVLGSFDNLMGRLSGEGFVPLHYVCTWMIGRITLLTPLMMRLVPALCGVAFIPAIYLLGRQLFDRRVALTAALLATVNAFGLTYSRDAKMYMQTWCFLTLCVGLLLLWWRSGKWWAWPAWVICGAAAGLFHVTALIVVGLCPIFLAVTVQKKVRWWRRGIGVVLLIVGLLLVIAPSAIYYLYYNQFIEKTAIVPVEMADDAHPNWNNSGLDWIERFNRGSGPWELTANSAANYLLGVQWPRQEVDPQGFPSDMPAWFPPACIGSMTAVLGLLTLGAWPWRHRKIADVAIHDPQSAIRNSPWWRRVALLSVWLILPTYGVFYCRSFVDPAAPWDVLLAVWGWLNWGWLPVIAATAALCFAANRWRWAGWTINGVFAAIMIGTLTWAIVVGQTQWGWRWTELLTSHAWLIGVIAVCGAAAWWRALGADVRERNRRLLTGVAIVAGLFTLCSAAWWVWHVLAQQYVASHNGRTWQSIWMPRYLGVVYPAVLLMCAALLMRLPTRGFRWTAVAVLVGLNLTQGVARIVADTEPPFDVAAKDAWLSHEDAKVALVFDAFDRPIPGAYMSRERISYYLDMCAGKMESKEDFDRSMLYRQIQRIRWPNEQRLKGYLAGHGDVKRLIVWERFMPDKAIETTDEGVYRTLEPGWKLVSKTIWHTRQFWTWREGLWYRRMVYEKQGE